MKVSTAVLQRVYEIFQASQEDPSSMEPSYLDPEANLHVLNAFQQPLWYWSVEKNGFERFRVVQIVSLAKLRSSPDLLEICLY